MSLLLQAMLQKPAGHRNFIKNSQKQYCLREKIPPYGGISLRSITLSDTGHCCAGLFSLYPYLNLPVTAVLGIAVNVTASFSLTCDLSGFVHFGDGLVTALEEILSVVPDLSALIHRFDLDHFALAGLYGEAADRGLQLPDVGNLAALCRDMDQPALGDSSAAGRSPH